MEPEDGDHSSRMDGDLEVELHITRTELGGGDYQGQEHDTPTQSPSPTLLSDGAFCLCPPVKGQFQSPGQVPDRRQGLPPPASRSKAAAPSQHCVQDIRLEAMP